LGSGVSYLVFFGEEKCGRKELSTFLSFSGLIMAVRNKIIHRIFVCVRENRKYEKIYTHALA